MAHRKIVIHNHRGPTIDASVGPNVYDYFTSKMGGGLYSGLKDCPLDSNVGRQCKQLIDSAVSVRRMLTEGSRGLTDDVKDNIRIWWTG